MPPPRRYIIRARFARTHGSARAQLAFNITRSERVKTAGSGCICSLDPGAGDVQKKANEIARIWTGDGA